MIALWFAANELPDAIGLRIQSGRTIDAIRLDCWWSRERVRDRLYGDPEK